MNSKVIPIVVGLAFLGGVAFYFLSPSTPKTVTPQHSNAQRAIKSDRNEDSGGTWQGRRARKSRGPKTLKEYAHSLEQKKKRALAMARRRREEKRLDGPTPDVKVPEQPAEQPPEGTKMGFLRGRVAALPSQKPITSFTVHYSKGSRSHFFKRKGPLRRPTLSKNTLRKSISHKEGHFNIRVPRGFYTIQIKAKGYQPSTPTFTRAGRSMWRRRVFGLLEKGEGSIRGQVSSKGQNSSPISGAMVTILPSGGGRWGWRRLTMGRAPTSSTQIAVTDSSGNFEVRNLPSGKYGIAVHASGHSGWSRRGIELADSENKDIGKIELNGNVGTIHGTLFGSDGKPVQAGFVSAISTKSRKRSFTRAGSDGSYVLSDVPTGEVRLFAVEGRRFGGQRAMKTVTLSQGKKLKADFTFGQGGLALKGRLLGPDGGPIAGAKIRASAWIRGANPVMSSGIATTDAQGAYSMAGLKAAVHNVTVEVKGKRSHGGSVHVKGETTEFDIKLSGGSLELEILDKTTQKPITRNYFAILSWKTPKPGRLYQRGKNGKKLVFENLPSSPMTLRVMSGGYGAINRENIQVSDNSDRQRMKITLSPAGKFLLILQTPEGKPPSRAYVMLSTNGKYNWIMSQPTAGGEWLVSSLPPGKANIKIMATGYKPLEVTIDVPEKGEGRDTFTLTPKEPTPNIKKPAAKR